MKIEHHTEFPKETVIAVKKCLGNLAVPEAHNILIELLNVDCIIEVRLTASNPSELSPVLRFDGY